MNPTSWIGSPSTDVDVIQCWFRDQICAYQFQSSTRLFTDDELHVDYDAWSTEGFTITCPCGLVIGSNNDPDEQLSEQEEKATIVPSDNTESDEDIDIEDVLPVDGRVAKEFIEHEGQMVHKASVV